jgi:hypothetical protein
MNFPLGGEVQIRADSEVPVVIPGLISQARVPRENVLRVFELGVVTDGTCVW